VFFKTAFVFDVSQTEIRDGAEPVELEPPHQPLTGDSHAHLLAPLQAFAARAVVRWSDGSEGEGLKWFGDEMMFCEGDRGNSRLTSSGVEMRGVAGLVGARRAT